VADDCVFCKIADEEIEADVVYSSDDVVAIRDRNPAAPLHVLVMPKRHVASIKEISSSDGELLGELFETMNRIAGDEGVDGGYRVVTNVGPDAGQSVFHLHFHLIGGRSMSWPPG
jgi:histidine triad (HIT) family protein